MGGALRWLHVIAGIFLIVSTLVHTSTARKSVLFLSVIANDYLFRIVQLLSLGKPVVTSKLLPPKKLQYNTMQYKLEPCHV